MLTFPGFINKTIGVFMKRNYTTSRRRSLCSNRWKRFSLFVVFIISFRFYLYFHCANIISSAQLCSPFRFTFQYFQFLPVSSVCFDPLFSVASPVLRYERHDSAVSTACTRNLNWIEHSRISKCSFVACWLWENTKRDLSEILKIYMLRCLKFLCDDLNCV